MTNVLKVFTEHERVVSSSPMAMFYKAQKGKMIRKRMERGFEKAKEEGRVGRPTKELPRNELEAKYKKKGWNYNALADYFDVSPSTIKRRLKEYGIKE